MTEETVDLKIVYPDIYEPFFKGDWEIACLYGGRDSCKSWMAALYCCLVAMNESNARVWAGREIQASIKESSHQTIEEVIRYFELVGFDVLEQGVYFPRFNDVGEDLKSEIFFKGLRGGSKIEQETRVKSLENIRLAWFEEAQSASEESLKMIEPTIRGERSQIIYTFNRLFEADPVFKRHCVNPGPRTLVLKINYSDVIGFITEKSRKVADRLKKTDPDEWLHVYGGEPRQQGKDTIISMKAINEAINRKPDDEGGTVIGIDVARFGDDSTVFVKRKGHAVTAIRDFQKLSITQVYAEAKAFCNKTDRINVDDSGVGGGLTDMFERDGYNVSPINFGEKAFDPDKYNNRISELWFEFPINEITLPDDDRLKNELSTRKYKYDTKDRRCVESKKDYKARGYRSPDFADAVLLAFAETIDFDFDSGIQTGKNKR